MSARVKLCAIAKDEGASLPEWIFHHLYFGFDGVEVALNQTTDRSREILERIAAQYPNVEFRNGDALLADSLRCGKSFQFRAYRRMAGKARRQGYLHVGFLDLDEYWMPRDFRTPIRHFLPEPTVSGQVVSFLWCLDMPDAGREPEAWSVQERFEFQLDPHVKSVIRLDDAVEQIRTHTARLHAGRRLLVREDFPLVNELDQEWGSLVPADFYRERRGSVPEAFVLHAMFRSPTEYLAGLAKGLRQTGREIKFKTNRGGYLPNDAPVLAMCVENFENYRQAREKFFAQCDVTELVKECRAEQVRRAEDLMAEVVADPEAMAALRPAIRGLQVPALDAAYPNWQQQCVAHLDSVTQRESGLVISGWAFGSAGRPCEFELELRNGDRHPLPVRRVSRPDVVAAHPEAPVDCGFEFIADIDRRRMRGATLALREPGCHFWDMLPLGLR